MSTEKAEGARLIEALKRGFSADIPDHVIREAELRKWVGGSGIGVTFVGHRTYFDEVAKRVQSIWSATDEPTGALTVSVRDVESPAASTQDRGSALEAEVADLRIRNERLRSLVAQERRVATHQGQTNEELLSHVKAQQATLDEMVNTLGEMAKANDSLQRALAGRDDERLRMFERHEGVVMHVDEHSVVVTYSIKDDYVDQTYRKEQFVGGRLPKKGDRLAIYVHVAEVPKPQDREPTSAPSPDEQRRHRKAAIRPPREF
ncbi:MAG TPA: hypothetical protein VMY37_37850 [Thermoguttaceae bacterium]|nr:hypothetical protein [Thermoguttaceae bacterium]